MLSRDYKGYKETRIHSDSFPGALSGFSGAKWRLAERVSRVFSEAVGMEERAVRVEVGGLEVSPVLWMREQRTFPRTYWSGREDGLEVAAVGVADEWRAESSEEIPSLPGGARYFGGLRFDAESETAAEWESFGARRFVLPRFEVVRSGGESRNGESGGVSLVCNLVLPRDLESKDEILAAIEGLRSPEGDSEFVLPDLVSRSDGPDFEGWMRNIERSLASFEADEMDKVVLARRADFVFERDLDAALLVRSLAEATPGCFHFYIEPREGEAFVGASPERLYRREGRAIRSEAVAGTRPRGDSAADDRDLRDDLLGSEKDREEHGHVRVGIERDLRPLCDALQVEEGVSEMKGASRRHLVSKVRGTLGEGATDADVLAAMHPTPAVGGYPRDEALREIRAMEDFDRGWYAGAVGWISEEAAEFAVGIRSGLVRGKELALYSGAGIVAGSTPEAEWAEIEQKISDFIAVLGLRDARREHAAR